MSNTPKPKQQRFSLVPEWTIRQIEKSLMLSGGSDARYEIELDSDEPSFFSSLKSGRLFMRSELNSRDQRVLEELITAEIVVPDFKKSSALKVAIIGDSNKLFSIDHKNILVTTSAQACDVVLIVRTSSTYADLLNKIEYQNILKPHLFVDMAFHHTLSVGPFVFPGETACIACLQGRVSVRWGDEAPPAAPRAVDKYMRVAVEYVATELDRIAHGDTSLTSKTMAWNFQDRIVKTNQLLKVPLCPICTQNRIDRNGALALPWSKDESATNSI